MHTLEKRLNYTFENKELLERALYHSSYANEHRGGFGSNERLEFLGDAVLGMVTADYLFHRHPDLPEGDLTRIRAALVCEQSLHEVAQRLGLGVVKFFPAAQSGGPAAIRALHGPFPGLQLLPTGGITLENLAAYLRCPAVLACGGSFLAPADVLARGDWAAVIRLCHQARVIAEEVSNG